MGPAIQSVNCERTKSLPTTVTTEFVLSSPDLPLVSVPERLGLDGVECVHGLCLERESRIYTVEFDPDDGVSEESLESLEEPYEPAPIAGQE